MIEQLGLFISLAGSLLVAYAIGPVSKNFGDGGETDGKEIAYFKSPQKFRYGILLIALGFLLQLDLTQDAANFLISHLL